MSVAENSYVEGVDRLNGRAVAQQFGLHNNIIPLCHGEAQLYKIPS